MVNGDKNEGGVFLCYQDPYDGYSNCYAGQFHYPHQKLQRQKREESTVLEFRRDRKHYFTHPSESTRQPLKISPCEAGVLLEPQKDVFWSRPVPRQR